MLHFVPLPGDERGNIKEPTQADIAKYMHLPHLVHVHYYFRESSDIVLFFIPKYLILYVCGHFGGHIGIMLIRSTPNINIIVPINSSESKTYI